MKEPEKLFRIYERKKLKIWMLFLVGIPAILILGSVFLPELFWERFLWRYIWGPVVADAEGRPVDGISAGYNPVNTLVYALILIISFFGIYEILKSFEIEVDRKFVYSLMPWIILGGALRSLEDVGLFKEPLDRFLITPLIYFLLGSSVLLLLVVGAVISKHSAFRKRESLLMRAILLVPIPFIYLAVHNFLVDFFVQFLIIIIVSMVFSFFVGLRYFDLEEKYLFFSYGTTFLVLAISYNAYHILYKPNTHPIEAIYIPALGAGITLLFFGGLWIIDRSFEEKTLFNGFSSFLLPLNILIGWSHLFDAASTYRGITTYGYIEKHVLPNLLIEVTGTPLVMFPLKLILICSVIYILDVAMEKELSEENTLVIFLKFLVITLGAAPAVRNTLRIAMGI